MTPEPEAKNETPERVTRALILAAGRGSRLKSDTPKPLTRVVGVTLLGRTLFTLQKAGVTDAYVVTGHEADQVRTRLPELDRLDLQVHWLHNPEWREPNGISVLAGESELDEPFFLTMTDHLFHPDVVRALAKRGPGGGINLAVDYRIDSVLDLDDATKVDVEDGRIVAIGKTISDYNAIDTGVFLASPDIFRALREARAEGNASLSAGVQKLAAEGRARATDIGDHMWQDVDTQDDLAEAERKLLAGVLKATDGPVSRYVNRPISTRLSRLAVKTPVTPNQISVSTLVLSLIAAGSAALGSYLGFLVAGFLFQIASIVDGTDGEVAKLKFQSSKRGEWVDTVCDNVSYLAFLLGVIVGVQRSGAPAFYFVAGVAGFAAGALSILNLTLAVRRDRRSGSFLSVRYGYQDGTGPGSRVMRGLHFLGKRDTFSLVAFVLAVVGQMPLALPLFGVGATLLLFPATLSVNLSSWSRARAIGRAQPPVEATGGARSAVSGPEGEDEATDARPAELAAGVGRSGE